MGPRNEDSGASVSAAPIIIPKKSYIPPPTVPENRALFRFLSGRNSTATTVFIGNISESCNDNLIRHLLQVVGRVINWRRVQGANAKLEPFGFAEYADQEDALRALRLVNGLVVCDRSLLTKVDEKTRFNLDRYEQEQRDYIKVRLKPGDLSEAEQIKNSRKIEDDRVRSEIHELLKGHIVFNKYSYHETKTHSENDNKDSEKKTGFTDIISPRDNTNNDLSKFSGVKRPRNVSNRDDRDYRIITRRSKSSDEEAREETYEKRRLERRRQYKEDCYLNRLKRWQNYEKNLQTEIEKRISREERRKIDREEKYKRLLDLLQNYDDDKDDPKYYKGSVWKTKILERESELEGDERDRKREKNEEELEKTKEVNVSSSDLESDPEPEVSIQDIQINLPPLSQAPRSPGNEDSMDAHLSTGINMRNTEEENLVNNNRKYSESSYKNYTPDSSRPIGFGIKRQSQQPSCTNQNTGLEEIFVPDELVEVQPLPKKVKLTVIDEKTKMNAPSIEYGPESAKYLTPYERNKKIKKLIEKVPTDKQSLFSYDVKWFLVDQQLIDKKIRPWLKKRIVEYIGEEETTLIKYISQKILEKSPPETILKDISMILDDEAEMFVIKLWRLLIYETEAKSMGLIQD